MKRGNPFQEIYAVINQEGFVAKTGRIKPFPIIIDVELTNYCNLKCLMCPSGVGVIRRPRGFMFKELFDRLLTEVANNGTGLRFSRWGEPFLHKEALHFFRRAKQANVPCHVNTNGHLLSEFMMHELVDMGFDSIKFSFQGTDDESYNRMRRGGAFSDLIEIIKKMHRIRGASPKPYLQASSTITDETNTQTEQFKRMLTPYVDLVSIGRTKLEHMDVERAELLSDAEKTALRECRKKESLVKKHFTVCPEVFDKLSVNWDGTVSCCCADYDNELLVGDLYESSLETIWRGDAIRRIRAILQRRQYDKLELCKKCYDTMALQSADNKV